MTTVNVLEAKTQLSKLIDAVESGQEEEIIIARNGKPAVRLAPLKEAPKRKVRLGLAAGLYPPCDDIDQDNAEIEKLFYGETD